MQSNIVVPYKLGVFVFVATMAAVVKILSLFGYVIG